MMATVTDLNQRQWARQSAARAYAGREGLKAEETILDREGASGRRSKFRPESDAARSAWARVLSALRGTGDVAGPGGNIGSIATAKCGKHPPFDPGRRRMLQAFPGVPHQRIIKPSAARPGDWPAIHFGDELVHAAWRMSAGAGWPP